MGLTNYRIRRLRSSCLLLGQEPRRDLARIIRTLHRTILRNDRSRTRQLAWLKKSAFGESAPQFFPRPFWVRISAYLLSGRSDERVAHHRIVSLPAGAPEGLTETRLL